MGITVTKLNNPGNIEAGEEFAGETGETYAGRFAVFDSPQMGIRALARDLRSKMNEFDGDVSKIMNKYAPPSENPATYKKYVKSKVGDKVTDENFEKLVASIIQFENKPEIAAQYLRPEIFQEGIKLSKINLPSGISLEDARNIISESPRSTSEGLQQLIDMSSPKRLKVDEPYETYERMRPYFEDVKENPQTESPTTLDIFNAIKEMLR